MNVYLKIERRGRLATPLSSAWAIASVAASALWGPLANYSAGPVWADPPAIDEPAAVAPAGELVAIQRGELPILLSAPHGGTRPVPDTEPRQGRGIPKGPSGFFTGRDTYTEELALAVAAAIEKRMQRKPYFVIARFHRKYIDPNRPPEIAYEDPDARPVYDRYHQTLDEFCRCVQRAHGRGLLLDLHGQGSARDTVFRGTQNGKTVTLLRQRFGEEAHDGPQSLFGTLRSLGWTVHPDPQGREQAGYTGGYIVQTYGSHRGHGIDAIQLEFGHDYRIPERRAQTAETLAQAVEQYFQRYLQEE